MKKRAPGWKKKVSHETEPAKVSNESLVTITSGQDAVNSWNALMQRVNSGESTLVFLDDDLPDGFTS